MTDAVLKADLHRYLRIARDVMLWKLDGLSEYQIRRPMTPTGTSLLGMIKHLTAIESEYFGNVFDRPFAEPVPWAGALDNSDMWATADESRDHIVGLYRRVCAHADSTIEELALDAAGHVPWWEQGKVTMGRILIHVTAETHRHAGHADIVRELIDGSAGLRADNDNMMPLDRAWWADHHDRVERAAREAGAG
jgi:Protein of unknown function (DUF664)